MRIVVCPHCAKRVDLGESQTCPSCSGSVPLVDQPEVTAVSPDQPADTVTVTPVDRTIGTTGATQENETKSPGEAETHSFPMASEEFEGGDEIGALTYSLRREDGSLTGWHESRDSHSRLFARYQTR